MPISSLFLLRGSVRIVALVLVLGVSVQAADTKVWIFCGTPGDDEHHEFYEGLLTGYRKVLDERFDVRGDDVRVLYGPESAGYAGPSTQENLKRELAAAAAQAQQKKDVWLIFIGHSNPTDAGVNFNIPGPDATAKQIGEWLAPAKGSKMTVFLTTSSSGRYLKFLAAPKRTVITATDTKEQDNETEFPVALLKALSDVETDQDADGKVSAAEIFKRSKFNVKQIYDSQQFIQHEHAMLDGDGDGRGTRRPSRKDEDAAVMALAISQKSRLLQELD
jgi:hypothetical protein